MNLKRISKILEDTNELKVRQIILDTAEKKKQIIYGKRAINRQLPIHLRTDTEDYDILTHKPKKSAVELAKSLKSYTREPVTIKKAKHKGTYKVKIGNKTVVDYTQLKRIPQAKTSYGNKFKDIKSIKKSIKRSLKKPGSEYRKEKDTQSLSNIKEMERIEKVFNS